MAKLKYVATNLIQGLQKKEIPAGATVELEASDAAPFVAGGSLRLAARAEPPAPIEPPKEPPVGGSGGGAPPGGSGDTGGAGLPGDNK